MIMDEVHEFDSANWGPQCRCDKCAMIRQKREISRLQHAELPWFYHQKGVYP